jgi:O-phosphoseryl-tRNA(Cys) synthetase
MPQDDCHFCHVLLQTHCEADSRICEVYEAYKSGRIDGDTALEQLYSLVSDEQLARLDSVVRQRLNQAIDPGQAAAEKWLRHYRFGKDG